MWERAPFAQCPACKAESSFGFLSAGGDGLTWRCTKCRYSETERLPVLDKKVIYLDQFAFSELCKVRTGMRRNDSHTQFWEEANRLLSSVVLLQQVVLPYSNVHHDETIVSHFAQELRETYEGLGGDLRLKDTETVQLQQIEDFARAFIGGEEPQPRLGVHDVLEGELNAWLPNIRVAVNMNWDRFADAKRRTRDATAVSLENLVQRWISKGYGFDDVLRIECGAYLQSRHEALIDSYQRYEREREAGDVFAAANMRESFVHREGEMLEFIFRRRGVPEDQIAEKIFAFWAWPKNEEQPFCRILAYLFAALAGQVKAGRRHIPSGGFVNDVRVIAAYAPSVDAMFIDNECATLLTSGRCRRELAYKAQIFSLRTKAAFLSYLRQLEAAATGQVRDYARIIYGLER